MNVSGLAHLARNQGHLQSFCRSFGLLPFVNVSWIRIPLAIAPATTFLERICLQGIDLYLAKFHDAGGILNRHWLASVRSIPTLGSSRAVEDDG